MTKQTKEQEVRDLYGTGMNRQEIVEKTGFKLSTVRKYITSLNQGFESHHKYSDHLAKINGFKGSEDYANHLAKGKGFKNSSDYKIHLRNERVKKGGFKGLTDYRNHLAKKKGFKNLADYNDHLFQGKGFKNMRDYVKFRELIRNSELAPDAPEGTILEKLIDSDKAVENSFEDNRRDYIDMEDEVNFLLGKLKESNNGEKMFGIINEYYFNGKTLAEMGRERNCTKQNVDQEKTQALEKLREIAKHNDVVCKLRGLLGVGIK